MTLSYCSSSGVLLDTAAFICEPAITVYAVIAGILASGRENLLIRWAVTGSSPDHHISLTHYGTKSNYADRLKGANRSRWGCERSVGGMIGALWVPRAQLPIAV